MSNTWFCSDLHFGHKNISKFRKEVQTEEDNRLAIKTDWLRLVHKTDHVYVLGDAAFTMETVDDFRQLPGTKHLVRGNHDKLDTNVYLKYFKNIYGLLKYKEFWLSHAPIHPNELRGRVNLHGHVHYNTVQDNRYFNCCPENLWKLEYPSLISIEQLRENLKQNGNSN
jgi:calcineurin-like phosphoesterase family protein